MDTTLNTMKEIEKKLNECIKKYKGCSTVYSTYKIGNASITMIGDTYMDIDTKHLEMKVDYDTIEEFALREDLEYNEFYIHIKTKDGNYTNVILNSMLEEK